MNDLDGQYGQNIISRLLFQFHVGGLFWLGSVQSVIGFHFQRIQRMFPRYGIEGGISYCRRFVASRHFPCGQSPHQLIIMGSLGVDTALDTD